MLQDEAYAVRDGPIRSALSERFRTNAEKAGVGLDMKSSGAGWVGGVTGRWPGANRSGVCGFDFHLYATAVLCCAVLLAQFGLLSSTLPRPPAISCIVACI